MSETATLDPNASAPLKLPGLWQLLKESLGLYKQRVWALYGLILRGILLSLAVSVLIAALFFFFMLVMSEKGIWGLFLVWPLGIFLMVKLLFKYALAMMYAAEGESRSGGEALALAAPGVWRYAGTNLLSGLLAMGGLLFFVVPGMVMSVWFLFTTYAFVLEDKSGMDAIMRSQALVRKRWWQVFWRVFAFQLLMVLINVVPLVGTILGLCLLPFGIVFHLVLFRYLVATRPEAPEGPRKKILFVGLFGYISIPVFLILFGAAIMGLQRTVSWDKLKLPGKAGPWTAAKASPAAQTYVPVMPEVEPPASSGAPAAAKRSTYTHEIIMRNGHRMSVRVVEEGPQGVMVELSPGARTMITRDEIAQMTPLNNEKGGTS